VSGGKTQTVLVCGARDWTDRATIREWIAKLPKGSIVVHGAAPGADTIAGEEARALGMIVLEYPADWANLGKAAGPIRNQRMLDAEAPDVVLAFSYVRKDDRGRKEITTGTSDMVARALEAGVRCTIIPRKVLTAQSLTAKPGEP
jgi:hypothetical protein